MTTFAVVKTRNDMKRKFILLITVFVVLLTFASCATPCGC